MYGIILGIVRHSLTSIGGWLVASGRLSASDSEQIIGGVLAVLGVAWSIYSKRCALAAPPSTPPQKKNNSTLPILLLCAAITLSPPGCASSPKTAAYQSVGTTITLVDASMRAWGDYVRAGYATPADETRVRTAYTQYSHAIAVARVAVASSTESPTTLDAVLDTLSIARRDVVTIISDLITPKKP